MFYADNFYDVGNRDGQNYFFTHYNISLFVRYKLLVKYIVIKVAAYVTLYINVTALNLSTI